MPKTVTYKVYSKKEWVDSAKELLAYVESSPKLEFFGSIGLFIPQVMMSRGEYDNALKEVPTDIETESGTDEDSEYTKVKFGPHTVHIFMHTQGVA